MVVDKIKLVKTSSKIVLVNIGLLVGCVGMLFVVPPQTSLKIYGLICVITIALINIVVFPRLSQNRASVSSLRSKKMNQGLVFVWVLFALSLALTWWLKHR